MKTIGVDATGKIWMECDGGEVPVNFNGVPLISYVLTDTQVGAYEIVRPEGNGVLFDGKVFTSIPKPPPGGFDYETAVQHWLDACARAKGYDSILSVCSYDTSKNLRFSADGIAYRDWRDAVWSYCYQALTDASAGTRPAPTVQALLAELPAAPA